MSTIMCSGCEQEFEGDAYGEGPAFDNHKCPATPAPNKGESFEDYKKRADAAVAAWRVLTALAKDARPLSEGDWGSDRQLAAENRYMDALQPSLSGEQWDALCAYALKATTEEMIAEGLRLKTEGK